METDRGLELLRHMVHRVDHDALKQKHAKTSGELRSAREKLAQTVRQRDVARASAKEKGKTLRRLQSQHLSLLKKHMSSLERMKLMMRKRRR